MQQKNTPPPPGLSLGLVDIYHILFRQKYKILSVWVIGLLATAVVKVAWPVTYQSQATLLVKYILEDKPYRPVFNDSSMKTPDADGAGSIKAEAQILGSFDLALMVVTNLGPDRILAKSGGGSNMVSAASQVQFGLKVEPIANSAMMQVIFHHADPDVVQPVLAQVIESYEKKHNEVHMASGATDDVLQKELVSLKSELAQTEKSLRDAKLKVGVSSLEDSRRVLAERIAKIQENLFNAKAEIVERQAGLASITDTSPASSETNDASPPPPPPEKVNAYKRICGLLETFEAKEKELAVQYTSDNPLVKEIANKVSENEAAKAKLEAEYPQLSSYQVTPAGTGTQPVFSARDVAMERMRLKSLEAGVNAMEHQLAALQKESDALDLAENEITSLQRKKDLLEQKLRDYSASVDKVQFNKSLASSGTENISVIESPTLPARDQAKLGKVLKMLLGGTLLGGLAIGFVIELYFDRSLKRPIEIESKLGIPLFLSIPRVSQDRKHWLLGGRKARPLLTNGTIPVTGAPADAPLVPVNGGPAKNGNGHRGTDTLTQDPAMLPFFDTLRDRLVMNFEIRNLSHKPKLVAVTSCAEGSGVSTVASGLAASLSKTGEGNVLLVDMNNVEKGVAHYFHKGQLECSLDDALQAEKRDHALVEENLYVVSESSNNGRLPQIMHKRFSTLLPKLRASDYDYIIFDMPAVSQVSSTPKLARFMDMVFLVVEAEQTDRDVIKRGTDLLTEAKATVGVVFNKSHNYLPRRLQQEL